MKLRITLLAFISLAGLLTACDGPEARPVSEELSPEEVNALLKKNPDFRESVELADRFRLSASTTELTRANNLSYGDLQQFLDELTDSVVRQRLQAEARAEWEARYGATAAQVPELIGYWHDFVDSLRPERYVDVRLVAIDPGESIYGAATVTLEFTPVRGPVDRFAGRFGLFPRNKEHGFDDFSVARNNNFDFPQGLRAPKRITTRMHYSIWDIADGDIAYNMYPDRPGLPMEKLLEKYWFDYALSRLVVDGREVGLSESYRLVPPSIRNYWNEADDEQPEREEPLLAEIARELIMPDFVEASRYRREYEMRYFRQRDSLAAWMVFDVDTPNALQ